MGQPPVPPNLGELVSGDTEVFRAFADKSFRDRKKKKVRYGAYLLRDEDVQDGLSLGLTPEASVRYLARNYGYCSIFVRDIVSIDNLEVRLDR
ncbi:MAG: hypothetical protein WB347_18455, partial [Terriglobales bacterium]